VFDCKAVWPIVALYTLLLTVVTTLQALERYQALETGWSWDLAYYNQWFWALTHGDGSITVRPLAGYATEGPSVWKMNYLAPIRFAIVPFYLLFADPRTLLVVQNVMFWWIIPASYSLVKTESESALVGLSAAFLVPATPLAWPLVWNDFRELQLGIPFVLWALQGWRSRDRKLLGWGVLGMLACRQEYAVILASFIIVPPRRPEDMGRTYLWTWSALMGGTVWLLFAFFGYLSWTSGLRTPEAYLEQFGGPSAPLDQTLATATDFLWVGMGGWLIAACLAPRVLLMSLPWVWTLSSGKWALRLLREEQWHHVRYTAPFFALVLAAGLVGYARAGLWCRRRPAGRRWITLAVLWGLLAGSLIAPSVKIQKRMAAIPPRFSRDEAAAIWRQVRQVRPEEGVLAHYDVTAPLSSRRVLYSYVMDQNKPTGYPTMPAEIRWAFFKVDGRALAPELMQQQGFKSVYSGPRMRVYRRSAGHRPALRE
jgi:hypothetical protein